MPTGTLTISQYTAAPTAEIDVDSLLEVRGWYNRSFISVDGVTPVFGNTSGGMEGPYYFSTTPTLNASGNLVVPAHIVQITVGANPTGNYFEGLWVDGAFSQMLIPNNNVISGWQIPSVYGDPIAYDELATYNRAKRLVYPPDTYFTADQVIQEIQRLAGNFDYMAVGVNGIGAASFPPVVASNPIVLMENDPRVASFHNISAYFASPSNTAAQNATFIAAAVAAATAAGAGIYIPVGTFPTNAVTINVPVLFAPSASILQPATGQSVSLTKAIFADTSKHFDNALSGQGTILLTGNLYLGDVLASWWGATTSGSATAIAAAYAAQKTASSGIVRLPDSTFLNAASIYIPLAAPGVVTLTDAGAGTLSAGEYIIGVVGVNGLGGEGQFDRGGYYVTSPAIRNTITIGANRRIDVSWEAVPGAAKYHVYVWGPSGTFYQRFYETTNPSLTLSTNPVGPVAALGTVTAFTTGGTLRRGIYYFTVQAEFPDGLTVDQDVDVYDGAYPNGVITTDTGSVDLAWTGLTGATQYRVYVISEQDGSPRTHTKYFVTAGTSVTVTGAESYIRGVPASQRHGNPEAESSAVGIFGSICTVSNSKNFLGADLQIVADKGADATIQLNRYDNTVFAGVSLREAAQPIWDIVMPNGSQALVFRHISNTDDVTVLTNGNVRIGRSGGLPQDRLVVVGSTTGLENYGIEFGNSNSGGQMWNQIFSYDRDQNVTRDLHINSDTGQNTLVLKADGKIGVQTNTPSFAFDVNGSARVSNVFQVDSVATMATLLVQGEGAVLTIGSNTITPTHAIHHVGAGLIKTITVPSGFTSGTIAVIPDAAFTYDATGNVIGTGTATIGRTMFFTYSSSSSKWYASY